MFERCFQCVKSEVPLYQAAIPGPPGVRQGFTYPLLKRGGQEGSPGDIWPTQREDRLCRSQKHHWTAPIESFPLCVIYTRTQSYTQRTIKQGQSSYSLRRQAFQPVRKLSSLLPFGKLNVKVCAFEDTFISVFVTSPPSPTKSSPNFLKLTCWKTDTPAAILSCVHFRILRNRPHRTSVSQLFTSIYCGYLVV